MKKLAVNILCGTGITLVVLATFGAILGMKAVFINSIFQSFGANTVIQLGYLLTHKFESKYPVAEFAMDIGYTITVLMLFGAIFNWFTTTPIWMLVIMAFLIYFIGVLLSIFRMRHEIKEINKMLKKRNR